MAWPSSGHRIVVDANVGEVVIARRVRHKLFSGQRAENEGNAK